MSSKLAGECGDIARRHEVNAAVEKHAWVLWKPLLKSELVASQSLFTVIRDFYQARSLSLDKMNNLQTLYEDKNHCF